MSYFFGEFSNAKPTLSEESKLLVGLLPSKEKTVLKQDHVFVMNYYQDKVIDDILIRHGSTDSWLMLVGMPLIKAESEEDRQHLLNRFLNDPAGTVLKEIDGHFALLAYDSRLEKFILCTDFNSLINIFYSVTSTGLVFSSSELGLASFLMADEDPLGFCQAVALGAPWDSRTRFKNIQKLSPCEILTIDGRMETCKEPYWEPKDEQIWQGNFDTIMDRWILMLKESVRAFYQSAKVKDVVWSDLTGGEDARLIIAACNALRLPYRAWVGGYPGDIDILTASKVAELSGIPLTVEPYPKYSDNDLVTNVKNICLGTEGYLSFFNASVRYLTSAKNPTLASQYLHFGGMPGGEAFRGSYYRRARIVFPSKARNFNYRFLMKFKFLLDYVPGLFNYSKEEFVEAVYSSGHNSLMKVGNFPAGTQVDHLLREYQTRNWGLFRRKPFYLPLGLKSMTRSIYNIPPQMKFRGKLTRACTERLFAELAHTKTQKGIPTIRRSLMRSPLFVPEYIAEIRQIYNGFMRRVVRFRQTSKTLHPAHRVDLHGPTLRTLLNHRPYSDWFASPDSMVTGHLYNEDMLDSVLRDAKNGEGKHMELLGRMIIHEFAFRYTFHQGENDF